MSEQSLTRNELSISNAAWKKLGFKVMVYNVGGNWVCDPGKLSMKLGYGSSSDEAIEDCKKRNEKYAVFADK